MPLNIAQLKAQDHAVLAHSVLDGAAEIERLTKDKERLDWLDKSGPTSSHDWDEFQFNFASRFKTIREAIDAARGAK